MQPQRQHSIWEKAGITTLGAVLVAAGVIMLVIPGPGWLTIAAGVAVWAREYHWARRLLNWLRQRLRQLREHRGQAPKE